MSRMNEDLRNETRNELVQHIQNGETDKFTDKIVELVENAEKKVLSLYEELKDETDVKVLANRGVYQLTKNETEFYNNLVKYIKNEEKGVTGYTLTLPVETENKIFEDIKKEHPLLSKVDFINNKGLTEWLMTTSATKLYAWGDLDDAIVSENKATIKKVHFSQFKLSAFMLVSLTAIELGLSWLDLYVRTILKEALATGMEKAIISGTGQKQPVGMIKEIDISNQTVPAVDKAVTAITELNVVTLGEIAKDLTNEGKRKVHKMAMIVNPIDYLTKVLPAITVQNTLGQYVQNLPFPLDIIESTEVESGKAIFGLLENYFATIGLGKEGKITYSDDYKFLEDVRTYKIKAVAYGTPKDNASFVVKDITGLKPAYILTKAVK